MDARSGLTPTHEVGGHLSGGVPTPSASIGSREIDGDESDEMKLAINASIPERDLLGVCVSMAMASYVAPAGTWIDRYSRIERRQAITMAKRGGIDADEVMHRCEVIKDEKWEEIISLSRRLVDEGRVEFGVAA